MTPAPEPVYLDGGLFAVVHLPAEPARGIGVVICPPLLGEYVQHHRAFYHLACRLAERGVAAIRFDWRGTGDSAGELGDVSPAAWRDDLGCAARALRERAGVRRLVLAGARTGATLAALFAADHADTEGVVLWEAVPDGGAWLGELACVHAATLAPYLPGISPPLASDGGVHDVLGFEIPARLWSELSALRLEDADLPSVTRVLVLGRPGQNARVRAALDPRLSRVWSADVAAPRGWLQPDDAIYDVLVPQAALAEIIAWVEGSAT